MNGEAPKVDYPDKQTVRYSWSRSNPEFLPRMAGASPLFIFRPAHYLKQFHRKYNKKVAEAETSGATKLCWPPPTPRRQSISSKSSLPTLQPWLNVTSRRRPIRLTLNPYFPRRLKRAASSPYVDRVVMAGPRQLIPAKTRAC